VTDPATPDHAAQKFLAFQKITWVLAFGKWHEARHSGGVYHWTGTETAPAVTNHKQTRIRKKLTSGMGFLFPVDTGKERLWVNQNKDT
jgi:hypothetical protein